MRCFGLVRELSPTTTQADGLRSAVGACRFAQNQLLADVKRSIDNDEKRSWSSISLHTRWRELRDEAAPWYGENSKEAYQFGAERLSTALLNWSASRRGKRRGKKVGFPGFRGRGPRDSVQFTAAKLRVNGDRVMVPRVGDVKLAESLELADGQRVTAVLIRPKAGRWFATFKVREDAWEAPAKAPVVSVVGVDLGVGDRLATLSDGTVIANPRFYRTDQAKLRRASKAVSRKKRGSINRRKAVARLAIVHYRIACRRNDFLHKLTTDLVKSHDEIVIEDLAVSAMARSLRLGKSVHDASNAELRRQLAYKCEWYGKTLTVVSRWFPSSKKCSQCGEINNDLTLSERFWRCRCGAVHDRDFNASFNLAASSAVTACGDISSGSASRRTKLVSAKQEEAA